MRIVVLAVSAAALLTGADIGPDSVWKDAARTLPEITRVCEKESSFPSCFAAQVSAKAPPAVAAFAKTMRNEAWMKAFREAGKVDVASVVYQFRANQNNGWLLVNGSPALFDPDDFKRLEGVTKNDPAWRAVESRYPKAMLFPGNRATGIGPLVLEQRDGTQEFIADYFVMNGCHACDVLGRAFVVFEFTPKGKFAAARFLGFDEAKDRVWLLPARSGQSFVLQLGCGVDAECEWTEEQRPAENILHIVPARNRGVTYEVTGSGKTQAALKRKGSDDTVILKVSSTPGLRR